MRGAMSFRMRDAIVTNDADASRCASPFASMNKYEDAQ
jgi:hypothetical protein